MATAFIDTGAGDSLWVRLGQLFTDAQNMRDYAAETPTGTLMDDNIIGPASFSPALAGLREAAFNLIVGLSYAYGSGACSDSPAGIKVPAGTDRKTIARFLRSAMKQYDGHAAGATVATGTQTVTTNQYIRQDGTLLTWDTQGAWSVAGYPVFVIGTTNDENETLRAIRAETLRAVMLDPLSQTVQIKGDVSYPTNNYLWTGGSGISLNMGVGEFDLHRNASMEYASAGDPARYTYTTGAGVITQSTAQYFDGAASLLFTGDGATKPEIRQEHGRVAGTPLILKPNTTYCLGVWVFAGGAIAAGATFDLDICNAAGTSIYGPTNYAADTVAVLSTTAWRLKTMTFTTGASVPDGLCSRIKFQGTALANAKLIYFDAFRCLPLQRPFAGNLGLAVFPGNLTMSRGDRIELVIATSRSKWNNWLDWVLDLHQSGVVLPTSGSPSVSEGLIT